MQKNTAIILAGGSGNRMKQEVPKAFLEIHEKYLIEYSIIQFKKCELIHEIILVVPLDYLKISVEAIKTKYSKISKVRQGAASRYESSCIGVNAVAQDTTKVLIHDAARPFLTQKMIEESIVALDQFDAINILAPVSDTLVQLKDQKFSHLLDRSQIRKAQTPQSFKLSSIKKAQELAQNTPIEQITDDFGLVIQHQTGSHSWIEGSQMNFKITYPEDLEFAKKLLQ
jgi:2-C-methyl-D-erythritol 4-phosphate cytidylyltransferase